MLCAYYQHSTMQHSCSRSALGIFRRLFFPFRKQRPGLGFAGDFLDGIAQCDSGGIIGRDFAQYCRRAVVRWRAAPRACGRGPGDQAGAFLICLRGRPQYALLVFGLTLAPSKECGRRLLTKLGLAQFTARLFCGLDGNWCRAFNIFDALPSHTVAVLYTRPIHTTPH